MKNRIKAMETITVIVFNSIFYGLRKHSSINKINHFLIVLFIAFFCISGSELKAQLNRNVLFLGNSYTGVNSLPQIVHDVALSAGDTLVFDSHTPGGYRLIDHSQDIISQTKIMTGGWDYVVMQGQSQEPITAYNQFRSGAGALYNLIKQYNPCAVIMPYMTWGRKNGDASNCSSFPVMCTYQGMDTTIRNCYLKLTSEINEEVAAVSIVWNYLRQNYPNLNLYQIDESHPSAAGSYAAACCFYTTLFKKDPTLITYNFGLNAGDAAIIKNAVKTKVFNSLQLWNFKKLPISDIGYQIGSVVNKVIFSPYSQGVQQKYFWDFGDGDTSSLTNPTHSYLTDGTYTVSLTTTNCNLQGVHTNITDTIIQFCNHTPQVYTTHPWLCNYDTLWTQTANAYQWYVYGTPIPATNQYLPDYIKSGLSGFSVRSTINGCSELSQTYTNTAQFSGYYFDIIGGDPCLGDTVPFAVLHINGSLSGLENILWFKNDSLLPFMTNEDTLLISGPGKYKCKVINSTSNCPLDTTAYAIEFNCGVSGIETIHQALFWTLFPNPASETISIKFMKGPLQKTIQIYNALGALTKEIDVSEITNLSIADIPSGLYFIRLKNNEQRPLRFIKQ